MSRYVLAPHVYSCIVEGHAIFFDLKSDRFSALDSSSVALLEDAVEGWPGGSGMAPVADEEIDAATCLEDLVNQGLLTEGRALERSITPVSMTPAWRDARSTQTPVRRSGSLPLFRFFLAWTQTWWMTRFWPIERIVTYVRERKDLGRRIAPEVNENDYLEALRDFRQCQRARWLRVGDGIREAVCLLQFMSGLGLYPTWVFGVRLKPFAARSWIQAGDLALNISAESARQFTPILVV